MAGSATITTKANFKQVEEALAIFGERQGRRLMSNAVNDSARQTRSYAARAVAKETGFKAAVARRQFFLRRSSSETLSADVVAHGAAENLIQFSARQTRRGVTARAWGKRKTYPGTFIATMRNGAQRVFTRKGRARLPIKAIWGPSVPRTLMQAHIETAVRTHAQERLQTNLARQFDRALYRKQGTR